MSRKIVSTFINRNPRNLELLRLQRKPSGYDFERNREVRNYIYKYTFVLIVSQKTLLMRFFSSKITYKGYFHVRKISISRMKIPLVGDFWKKIFSSLLSHRVPSDYLRQSASRFEWFTAALGLKKCIKSF
jgi:hypothetical protein